MPEFPEFAERERSGWANPDVVHGYVDGFGAVVNAAGNALAEMVPARSEVLDLCCGHGHLTAALAVVEHRVTGLDFSPAMLAIARSLETPATFVEGDAQNLAFADDIFDAVTCNFGLFHIPDQPKALSEIRRVLRPGGRFVMSSWIGPEASDTFRIVFGTARANMPPDVSPPPAPDFFRYGRPDDARAAFEEAGFEVTLQDVLPLAWTFPSPDGLFDAVIRGTVMARMMLMALPDETREKVRREMAEQIEAQFRDGDAYVVPSPVARIVARPV